MARRIGIQPDWVEDLLGLWAAADATGASGRGHDRACPMFKLWGVVDDQRDDADDSYTGLELQAMRQALERLRDRQPEDYQAILATFKPWAGVEANAGTAERARRIGVQLAAWVDEIMGG